MVTVIDIGISNIGSVLNMLGRIGVPSRLGRTIDDVERAERIILPGVGHFRAGMSRLNELNLVDPIRDAALKQQKPVLGICLGMQLLLEHGDEGDCPGLGIVAGQCIRFNPSRMEVPLPIPHMGWRSIRKAKRSALTQGLDDTSRFYFVHSYHAKLADASDTLLEANYGYPFVAAYERANVAGVQFHPEKSHTFGEQLLANFALTSK